LLTEEIKVFPSCLQNQDDAQQKQEKLPKNDG